VRLVSPKSLARDVRQTLKAAANPTVATGAQRFFKEQVRAYGVYTPIIKQVVQEIWPTVKPWTWPERFAFCEELWRSGILEEGILVTHLARKWAKTTTEAEIRICGDWMESYVTNWAQCDNLCLHWIALAIAKDPGLIAVMDGWEDSPVLWKRRASMAGLVHEVRRGRQHARARRLIAKLKADPEELVRKGAVWLQKGLDQSAG
jgi:3-methyladenine DNA glycosylase AlkD